MDDSAKLPTPAAVCEGGDLDCGSGLLLIIRQSMNPLDPGQVLEVRSREKSVREDLPAWCRLAGHQFLGEAPVPGRIDIGYFVRKGEPVASQETALEDDLERARNYEWATRIRLQDGPIARVYARNHTFDVGQPASFAAADPAVSAIEYLLGAVGASLVVGYAIQASRQAIAIDDLECSIRGKLRNPIVLVDESAGSPALELVRGSFYVTADSDYPTLRAIWQTTLSQSPIIATLQPVVQFDLKFVTVV